MNDYLLQSLSSPDRLRTVQKILEVRLDCGTVEVSDVNRFGSLYRSRLKSRHPFM